MFLLSSRDKFLESSSLKYLSLRRSAGPEVSRFFLNSAVQPGQEQHKGLKVEYCCSRQNKDYTTSCDEILSQTAATTEKSGIVARKILCEPLPRLSL